jgi:hypothetical protein
MINWNWIYRKVIDIQWGIKELCQTKFGRRIILCVIWVIETAQSRGRYR